MLSPGRDARRHGALKDAASAGVERASKDGVATCFDCIETGGGIRCDAFLDCGDDAGCFSGGGGVCGSGVSYGDPLLEQCLGRACCDEYMACSDGGENVQSCIDCFNFGGGPICDDAVACAQDSGCLDG